MSKEKTPIEELIEFFNNLKGTHPVTLSSFVNSKAKELLVKEREAIEEAYYEGFYDSKHSVEFDNNYYKDKYGK